MKSYLKFISVSLFFLIILNNIAIAQIFTITKANHEPQAGQDFDFYLGNNASLPAKVMTGNSVVWDYSNLKTPKEGTQQKIKYSFFTNTNNNISNATVADSVENRSSTYNYYSSNNSNFFLEGFQILFDYNGTPTKAFFKATDHLNYLYFPSALNDNYVDNFSGNVQLGSLISVKLNGKSYYKVSGFGKLKLPYNIEIDNVLQIERRDSGQTTPIPFASRVNIEIKDVLYYIKNNNQTAFPVLRFISQTYNGSTQKYLLSSVKLDSSKGKSVYNLSLEKKSLEINLYPNPTSSFLISNKGLDIKLNNKGHNELNIDIEIIDILGRTIKNFESNSLKGKTNKLLNIKTNAPLQQGIYFVKISVNNYLSKNKSSILTKKLVIY